MKLQKKYFLYLRFFKQKSRSYQVEKNIDLLHTAFYVPGAMSSVYIWPDHLGRLLVATCAVAASLTSCVCRSKWEAQVSAVSVAVLEFSVRMGSHCQSNVG